jgi:hypothetical protein
MADDVDQLHVNRIHRSEYQLYSYREYPPGKSYAPIKD